MNVPVLEDYMNSDSEVLEEYRGFLTGSAFRNIVYDLKTKYNATRDDKYWQKIYDMSVTGKLEYFTRDSINAKIADLGAKAASSVSKKTDYLITNEASGSSKYKKAVELNVPIITEKEFLKMCGD